ncbi:hypothetical protein JCM8547_007710 [Rhodosporidiobolus lusitaniae]
MRTMATFYTCLSAARKAATPPVTFPPSAVNALCHQVYIVAGLEYLIYQVDGSGEASVNEVRARKSVTKKALHALWKMIRGVKKEDERFGEVFEAAVMGMRWYDKPVLRQEKEGQKGEEKAAHEAEEGLESWRRA